MLRPNKKGKFIAKSWDQIKEWNKMVVRLGEELGKPVCATGDVHFLDPEDEIYRHVLLDSKGFADADAPTPLYFRTTEEMLEEFSYLGKRKAYEVVVTNTNLVASWCEEVKPLPDGLFAPKLENSADTQILGTTGFAAPEQYGLSQSDIRTDIYALGVLINVMLTGEHPSKKLAEGKMGRIVDRCTHVNPQRRYKNVLRLMEAL